ncbi:DUF2071 domain-containing protein [Aureibaculum sp. 2210JD6-5]|uniref:YqjF family protein n=1 Tax=Aureibaculum sp. 2210JD6-5 TaxID=3103957 RepID=UPI002AADFBAD|nr:DUF2071 domain-containing protein [Aureibaculum sp. 2210JD6-5]MDY7395603.1 DUF2071 domain-containing protein [Aureibaculum sp. 2210JD6-5]
MSFLTAEWRKLAIANYVVDPSLLREYIPYGTELDLYNNKCYVSLVGFMFINTKLLGFKIPFHSNFEEVNLRFYVKHFDGKQWKRGVVFIKEIVPKPALSFIANTVYNENYETLPMSHSWLSNDENLTIEYKWKKCNYWNKFKVIADLEPTKIEEGSETEFITEHYWGYAKVNDQHTNEYEVTHPKWLKYNIIRSEIDVNFDETYGEKFSFLNQTKPISIMLAEGSEITVENKRKLKKS